MSTAEARPGRVGVIGLGNIGGGMVRRLLDLGHEVVVWDSSDEALGRAVDAGAVRAESNADIVARCEVVVSSLPNPAIVRAVYLPPGGILTDAAAGTTFIETSTIDPDSIRAVASAGAEVGAKVLDVALSGEPPQAATGELVFQVGGDDDLVEATRPVLEALSKKINRTGDVGSAKTVKLVNNLMSLGNVAVAAEAFSLGVKCGMDPAQLYEILSVSGGRSAHFVTGFAQVIEDDFRPRFATALALKDIRLIRELEDMTGHDSGLAAAVTELYQRAVDSGLGAENFTSVVKLYGFSK